MMQQANSDACVLLIFQLSDRRAAFPIEDVERIVPMAELASPPGMPSALEGFLNLAGAPIPVLRLDRLFGVAAQQVGLYSMLIVLRATEKDGRIAILADRVHEIVPVSQGAFLPIALEDSLNACAEAAVDPGNGVVHLLSPARILLAREREVLSEFQAMVQERLQKWETSQP